MDEEATNVGLITSLKYLAEGWADILYAAGKKPIGLWLKSAEWGKHEHVILISMCSMLEVFKEEGKRRDALPDDLCRQIYEGHYRIVENTIDARGGVFVLVGGATIPEKVTEISSSPSGCFIATAVYGSTSVLQVRVLQEFRDLVLARNGAGRAAIKVYYKRSPPAARFIASHPVLRKLVRIGLVEPVVAVVRLIVGLMVKKERECDEQNRCKPKQQEQGERRQDRKQEQRVKAK